jgi:hypothetical protein
VESFVNAFRPRSGSMLQSFVQCGGNVNDRRSRLYNPVPLDTKTVDVGSAVEHVVLGKSGLDSGTALLQLRALCPPDCHLLRLYLLPAEGCASGPTNASLTASGGRATPLRRLPGG